MNPGNYVATALLIAFGTGTGIYAYNALTNSTTIASRPLSTATTETTESGAQVRVNVSSQRSGSDGTTTDDVRSLDEPSRNADRPLWQRDRDVITVTQTPVERLLETNECPGCDLREANLEGVDLSGANLAGANLEGASLAFARLENANLKGANLSRSNLEGANLGCNASFNIPRQSSGGGFSVHSYSNNGGSSNVNIDVNINKRNARVDVNASGDIKDCIVLRGTNLKEARLPDGSVYQ